MSEEIGAYCTWCGRKLVRQKDRHLGYNWKTREPEYLTDIYACPARKFFLFWHDHVHFRYNEQGRPEMEHMGRGD